MRIALDAMGGDDAPSINIDGALTALAQTEQLSVDLVGDKEILTSLLKEKRLLAGDYPEDRLRIVPAEGFVGMEEKPTVALRKKPNSSIAICWKLMAEKKVQAIVSAGNTGASVAAGLRTRLFLKNVKRPGIAAVLPTLKGHCIIMDVGANPAARSDHLYQYGVMGAIYAREMFGVENPQIGLLNIGSEDGKGTSLVREANQFLLASHLNDQYIGNIEGRGISKGEADVVICEGFVGNVVLKVSEGMADMMFRVLSEEISAVLDTEKTNASDAFKKAASRYEYQETGGAPLLGIDGLCMICHGSSNAHAMTNALTTCIKMNDRKINASITTQLATMPTPAV